MVVGSSRHLWPQWVVGVLFLTQNPHHGHGELWVEWVAELQQQEMEGLNEKVQQRRGRCSHHQVCPTLPPDQPDCRGPELPALLAAWPLRPRPSRRPPDPSALNSCSSFPVSLPFLLDFTTSSFFFHSTH